MDVKSIDKDIVRICKLKSQSRPVFVARTFRIPLVISQRLFLSIIVKRKLKFK